MNITGRIAKLAATGIASLVASKAAVRGWEGVTGNEPPADDDSTFSQIIVFAAVSAILVAALQFLANKGVNKLLGGSKGAQAGADAASETLDS